MKTIITSVLILIICYWGFLSKTTPDSNSINNAIVLPPISAPVKSEIPNQTNTLISQAQETSIKFIEPNPIPKQDHWTWTTSIGITYQEVKILKVEADCVTIMHSNGGGKIDISTLSPDIQKCLNYDPYLAKLMAEFRKKEDAKNYENLRKEEIKIVKNKSKEYIVATSNSPAASNARVPLSSEDVAFIQSQIKSLQEDIDFMKREKNKETSGGKILKSDNRYITRGAYDDKILEEQNQINQFKMQLTNP